jgi:hypothetical protein
VVLDRAVSAAVFWDGVDAVDAGIPRWRYQSPAQGQPRSATGAEYNAAIAALIAAATAGKALVDDDCAKKAVAELTRE